MNFTPTINIVTPCYNAAGTLDETVQSVVSQAGPFHIRYHVQDGGSSDGTIEKLEAWEKRFNDNSFPLQCDGVSFTWSSEPDGGMYDAINKGFKTLDMSTDAIMAWVNADDTYSQHVFATAQAVFDQNPDVHWLGGMIVLLDDSGCLHPTRQYDYYPHEFILNGCCGSELWPHLQQNGMFWRHSLWAKTGGLDTSLRFAGDWELWQRFARHAEFIHIRAVFGTFRILNGQLSQDARYTVEQEALMPLAEREQLARNIYRQHLLPPAVPLVDPHDARTTEKRMRIVRKVPVNGFTEYQKQRFRLMKKRLPTSIRTVLGTIRRSLQRLIGTRQG